MQATEARKKSKEMKEADKNGKIITDERRQAGRQADRKEGRQERQE